MKLPPYDVFPVIRKDNLLLRQIIPTDIPGILELSYYDAKPAQTVEEAIIMQERINADYQNGTSIHWGIIDLNTNFVIGTCGYYRGLDTGMGELGCILKSEYRGQGYMRAALELIIQFGQNTIKLKGIKAITTLQNTVAIHLLKRLNFEETARLMDDEIEFRL